MLVTQELPRVLEAPEPLVVQLLLEAPLTPSLETLHALLVRCLHRLSNNNNNNDDDEVRKPAGRTCMWLAAEPLPLGSHCKTTTTTTL